MAVGVLDVCEHLLAERPLAGGRETCPQLVEIGPVRQSHEARLEALDVAESIVIDDADEAVKLEQRILKRRRGKQNLGERGNRLLDRERNLAGLLVDVSKTVGFICH